MTRPQSVPMSTSGYPKDSGHTGLVLAYTVENGVEMVYTIEGNSEDSVSVCRRKRVIYMGLVATAEQLLVLCRTIMTLKEVEELYD